MSDTKDRIPETAREPKRRNPVADFFVRLVREKPLGTACAVIVLLFLLAGIFAQFIAPHGYNEQFGEHWLEPPSRQFWLGTDNLGRDLLSRIIYGARISMIVGVLGSSISLVVSCIIGIPSGYLGGTYDLLVQRFVDAWLCFPGIIILILLVNVVGPGLWTIVFILGITGGIGGSRSVRGVVIDIRQNVYLDAAKAIGCPTGRILMRHILPNIFSPLIILFSTRMPGMMLSEAGLSFLGLGIPPPMPSWGGMLSGQGLSYMLKSPTMALWPGIALSIVVYSTNMFGDALRDILDPRLRGGRGGHYGRTAKQAMLLPAKNQDQDQG